MPTTKKINLGLADEQLSTQDKTRIADELQKREQAPSARAQSDSYQFFLEQINELGNPYDVTHIPIDVLKQMERDPMIAFGLHFSRTPIMRARWNIECERADIAAAIDRSLRPILPKLISQYSRSWNYGFSPIVKRFQLIQPDWTYVDLAKSEEELKVWDHGNVDFVTWKSFVSLPCNPNIVEPRWTESGQFNGIRYNGGSLPLPFRALDLNDKDKKLISLQHSLWATNEKATANESLWGYPRVGYAYRYWWSYWFRWALYDRFFERKADPPYVVYYPSQDGSYAGDGEADKTSMKAIALSIGESARGGGAIAMPGETITGYDDRPTSMRQWEIKELEVKGDMSHFVETFEYLDIMKLRALLVPEQAFLEGKGGTSSRNVASEEIDVHKQGTAILSDEIDDHINRFVIPDLVAANFPDFKGECRKVTTGFAEADQSQLKEVIQLFLQADQGALQNVDIREVLDRAGMPLVSQAEIKRQEEKIKAELEEAGPPPVEPVAGKSAGVNEEGLYVAPREVVRLSDDASFTSRLPKSRHYEDKTVVSNARKLRDKWNKSYKDIYSDFADFVKDYDDLDLAESKDKAERMADRILKKWKYNPEKIETLLSSSNEYVKKIIEKAGKRELKRIRTEADWSVDREDVAEFLDDRGAVYVKAVNDTVKDEIRPFLANQIREGKSSDEIASAIREHFADFPSWKADRLARTEVRDAYNFATLSAGEEAGIKIVQTIDAQLGEDRSDADCIERNGEFMKIGDALSEVLKEHPNGTIEVRLTKRDNLSTEVVDEIEGQPDTGAYFDEETDTIYFTENLSDDSKLMYLDQLGSILENE